MDRKQILAKIDSLNDGYEKLTPEEQKQRDSQTMLLGEMLLKPKQDKIENMLRKGRDLTYAEIMYLLEQEVPKRKIRKAMKINSNDLDEFIKSNERGSAPMSKGNLEKAQQLLAETDLPVMDIVKETGVKDGTVYYHARKIRNKDKATKKPLKEPKSESPVIAKEKYKELLQEYSSAQEMWKEREVELRNELESLSKAVNLTEEGKWKEKYEQEKKVHEHLLNYLKMVN